MKKAVVRVLTFMFYKRERRLSRVQIPLIKL
jgi:hypothetical protein